jgi:hypothetical protein
METRTVGIGNLLMLFATLPFARYHIAITEFRLLVWLFFPAA